MSIPLNEDFHALAKKENNARKKQRLLALAHFKDGRSRYEIASFLKVSRTSVNKWVRQYLDSGLAGLEDKKQPGRPSRLTDKQLQRLSDHIDAKSKSTEGGRLIGSDIQAYMATEFGVEYQQAQVYRILRKLGFSWLSSRSKHPKQNKEVQEDFKKIQNKNDP